MKENSDHVIETALLLLLRSAKVREAEDSCEEQGWEEYCCHGWPTLPPRSRRMLGQLCRGDEESWERGSAGGDRVDPRRQRSPSPRSSGALTSWNPPVGPPSPSPLRRSPPLSALLCCCSVYTISSPPPLLSYGRVEERIVPTTRRPAPVRWAGEGVRRS